MQCVLTTGPHILPPSLYGPFGGYYWADYTPTKLFMGSPPDTYSSPHTMWQVITMPPLHLLAWPATPTTAPIIWTTHDLASAHNCSRKWLTRAGPHSWYQSSSPRTRPESTKSMVSAYNMAPTPPIHRALGWTHETKIHNTVSINSEQWKYW